VRHGAVQTLTGVLLAHDAHVDAPAWCGCVRRTLLHLQMAVMLGDAGGWRGGGEAGGAAGAACNGAHGGGGGATGSVSKNGGGGGTDADTTAVASCSSAIPSAPPGMQLLQQHSRDTPVKQWNETRVLALAGVARVLRRYLCTSIASREVAGWGRALAAATVAAAATEPEVAAAGVSALLDLLAAAGAAVFVRTRAVGEARGRQQHHRGGERLGVGLSWRRGRDCQWRHRRRRCGSTGGRRNPARLRRAPVHSHRLLALGLGGH